MGTGKTLNHLLLPDNVTTSPIMWTFIISLIPNTSGMSLAQRPPHGPPESDGIPLTRCTLAGFIECQVSQAFGPKTREETLFKSIISLVHSVRKKTTKGTTPSSSPQFIMTFPCFNTTVSTRGKEGNVTSGQQPLPD